MTCRISLTDWNGRKLLLLEGSDFLPQQQSEIRALSKSLSESSQSPPILIDTSGLGLVGSCCLGALIELAMTCRKLGIPCAVVEARPEILDVFDIVSLQSILPVFDSLESAGKNGV
ncbi:MAG TPA: STAS domain-containing protein [Fibrobacteria bacterium]|nr:STAS domain-containing protein [Fibrobacteria bacterium]HOX51446.1 STAS domain-containing protein [Fibrobacteria bacterium]